ncbi:tannase/feruloyl esterase family alpha/beta hydrolase [Aquincola sp. MAHUQ-54]|uniref:Tannase/feruloyl esterase family alpha/beta hydrolase n=1 Tax=Aquincola agrisoli TaxID=3119538 RepID=A0AAW9QH62_9BURK
MNAARRGTSAALLHQQEYHVIDRLIGIRNPLRPSPARLPLAAAAGLALLAACGGDGDGSPAPSASFTEACAALAGTSVDKGSVDTAAFTTATGGTLTATSMPDHCLVRGAMNRRTGIDGKPYALQFELRLPLVWNSRFYYQGGSGVDGTLFTATGSYPAGGNTRNALLDGYAVVTTDSGHLTEAGAANGMFLFGADPQARDEYGDAQLPLVTAAAKTLIKRFYGDEPSHSYFVGCSNGGRQAMVAAQRYPQLFDGIVAAAPGFRLTQASIQGSVYQAQLAATIAPSGADGRPDITQPLTAGERAVVSQRILDACDALDGAVDGMVSKMSACQPDPATWACGAGETTNCLPAAKAGYVKKLFAGAYTSTGQQIYAPWPFDPGMAAQATNPFHFIFAGEASHIYTTPPTLTADLVGYSLGANIDVEFAKLSAISGLFKRSGNAFTNADSPDMDAFKARGGKLIMFNGAADLAFSNHDLVRYYEQVRSRYGADAAAGFARVFLVPGMAHCSGGPYGTDQFDAFGALVRWVEAGTAPDTMTSTARAAAGVAWPGRTRPLCAYPKEAIYKGSGSIEDAANFACQ